MNNLIEQAIVTCASVGVLTNKEISEAYSVPEDQVASILRKHRIKKKNMFPEKLSDSKIDQIIKLYSKNMKYSDIAKEVGTSLSTVSRYVQKHNGTYVNNHKSTKIAVTEDSKYYHLRDAVKKLVKRGDLQVEIAEELNVRPSIVHRMVKTMGLRPRKCHEHIAEYLANS